MGRGLCAHSIGKQPGLGACCRVSPREVIRVLCLCASNRAWVAGDGDRHGGRLAGAGEHGLGAPVRGHCRPTSSWLCDLSQSLSIAELGCAPGSGGDARTCPRDAAGPCGLSQAGQLRAGGGALQGGGGGRTCSARPSGSTRRPPSGRQEAGCAREPPCPRLTPPQPCLLKGPGAPWAQGPLLRAGPGFPFHL